MRNQRRRKMKTKTKKQFSLVNLMKGLTKKEQKAIVKEEEMMEDIEEKEMEKRVSKSSPCADLPKEDYDAILGFARQDGKIADPMTAEDYINYLLHRPRIKKEERP